MQKDAMKLRTDCMMKKNYKNKQSRKKKQKRKKGRKNATINE